MINKYPDQNGVEKGNKYKKYFSPRLKYFGSVTQLTTSGSGLNFESFAQGMCDASSTKRINPSCP